MKESKYHPEFTFTVLKLESTKGLRNVLFRDEKSTTRMMLVSTPRKSIRNSLFPKNLEERVSDRFSLQTFRIRDIFTSG